MSVPFVDLKAQYREIGDELEPIVREIMAEGRFVLGPEVRELEEKFAAFCGTQLATGLASGTDALQLSLKALGIGPGDEVIAPTNTFIATAVAVSFSGAKPVLVDVDEKTYNIDPARVEEAVTERTKAIIPVHLYGQPADMDPLLELARARGLLVIEDACQAHGAEYKGRPVGSLGDAGCFSFYPGKNLGAYGDGGMVVTDDTALAARLALFRDVGRKAKYLHSVKGHNSRLDNIQAAVLLVKLKYLPRWNEARRRWAALYDELLADTPCICPYVAPYTTHVYHLYVIRVKERDALMEHLKKKGVASGIHYPVPIHLQEAYGDLGKGRGAFPVAERVADEILSLPIFPELGEAGVRETVDAIKDFFS